MRADDPGPPHYLISVDLGIAPARTAIAVMERHGVRPTVELHVRALSRPPLGTKTAAVIEETRALCDRLGEQLVRQYARWADPEKLRRSSRSAVVDLTGSGLPALALFTQARIHPIPIWLTNGMGYTHESGGYRVAKPDLISALSLMVEDGRLKVAAGLPDAPAVLREFQRFEIKDADVFLARHMLQNTVARKILTCSVAPMKYRKLAKMPPEPPKMAAGV